MPTLTLSWTDMALFGLTAGLIGAIFLVGRSNSPFNRTAPSTHKKSTQSKKKKKTKRGERISGTPTLSSSLDRHQPPGQSSPTPQAVITPESIPEPPPAAQSQTVQPNRLDPSQSQTAKKKKKKAAKKPAEIFNHQDFPPLAAAKDENKVRQNKPKRPFAESHHQQPVRKTVVDDMIDEDLQKPFKMTRVMNIVNPGPEVTLSPSSDPKDGWEEVPDSKRSRTTAISISPGSPSSVPIKPKQASEQATSKRQRQNAKKKEAAKALKLAQEAQRLCHLSAHKREQERLRMNLQTRSPQPSTTTSIKPLAKKLTTASIAEDGRLIWESARECLDNFETKK